MIEIGSYLPDRRGLRRLSPYDSDPLSRAALGLANQYRWKQLPDGSLVSVDCQVLARGLDDLTARMVRLGWVEPLEQGGALTHPEMLPYEAEAARLLVSARP